MNGGLGRDVYGFVSTLVTENGRSTRPSLSRCAPTSSSTATSSRLARPWESKSRLPATRCPSRVASEAVKAGSVGNAAPQVPVAGRHEGHALALSFDDEADAGRLDPPGAQALADLAPAHLGDGVAVEAVDDATALLGVDEAVVDVAALVDGVLDGGLGDLVEHHPLHGHRRLQHLEEVPRDGLALAVLIRREVELVGVLERPLQLGDRRLLAGVHLVVDLEVVVDVDAEPLGGQVADVAHRREHGELAAQEALDGAGFGGGLHDHERLGHRRNIDPTAGALVKRGLDSDVHTCHVYMS